jgi:hypothetical protein
MTAPDRRPTPYDLIFDTEAFARDRFEQLRGEVEARGAATVSQLLSLPAAGEALRDLVPDGSGPEHRALVAEVGSLVFHAFRFWLHGRHVYRVGEKALRALLAAAPATWSARVPHPAGYVQLPRNTVWARPAEDAAAEPVDGFFWSSPDASEGVAGQRLDLLFALGLREGRPGLTVVALSLEPGTDIAQWADVKARPDGEDFANVLPGGELQGYLSVTTHAEALKLAVRTFRWVDGAGALRESDGVHHVEHG